MATRYPEITISEATTTCDTCKAPVTRVATTEQEKKDLYKWVCGIVLCDRCSVIYYDCE